MSRSQLNDCGCCEGLCAETPAPVENRRGLGAVAYRCGTQAQFKQSMLAALSNSALHAVQDLKTRDDDDFSIAVLDAWATAADVLTFYQERIANESFLRTATERLSLLELARLIGYELRPGVAASAYLAFTLEDTPGSPRVVTIDTGTKVQSVPGPGEKPQTFETVEKIEARIEWNAIKAQASGKQSFPSADRFIYVKGIATNLRKGDGLILVAIDPSTSAVISWVFRRVEKIVTDSVAERSRLELEDGLEDFKPEASSIVEVHAFHQRASLFGHNAPDARVLANDTIVQLKDSIVDVDTTTTPPSFKLGSDWKFDDLKNNVLDLDAHYPTITAGAESWFALIRQEGRLIGVIDQAEERTRKDFTLTLKISRLNVKKKAGVADPGDFGGTGTYPDGTSMYRATSVYAQSEKLERAEAPIELPMTGNSLTLAGEFHDLQGGQFIVISGPEVATGKAISRLVKIESFKRDHDLATVVFSPAIDEKLEVKTVLPTELHKTVTVNANVVRATHGETVGEVLGSGDAGTAYQRFALRQPPLTYVRGAGASGAVSSIAVRVNDLLWHEVSTLYGCGPRDRVFVTHTDDDGKTTIQFGDGVTGARPPSGQENVRASYRKGIGLEGLVKSGQLSMLMTRPLGVKGVTNPQDAEGAADREILGDARRNAPVTVLTLDRIVSLQDYEDFVRAYAGIAKALATWVWDNGARGVFLTVAGPGGAEIDMAGDFAKNLLAAVRKAAEPFVPVRVQSYRKNAGLFTLVGKVKIDPDYEVGRVLAAVRIALESQFSFDARNFGEHLTSGEITAVIQTVPGVIAAVVELHPLEEQKIQRRRRRMSEPAGSSTALPAILFRLATPISAEQIGVMT